MSIDTRYAFPAPVGYEGDSISGSGIIANISRSGALIDPADPPVAPGANLGVRLSYFQGSYEVELLAEVVRATEAGFAVRFSDLRREVRSLLDAILPGDPSQD